MRAQRWIDAERLRNGAGIGETGSLDHDAVEADLTRQPSSMQSVEYVGQIATNAATDATVAHFDDPLVMLGQEDSGIDADFAKFVFNDGDAMSVRRA